MRALPFEMLGFLRNVFYYRMGIDRGPYLCVYIPTLRCNARCQACDIWKLEKNGEEMTFVEVKALFEQMSYLKVVKITGGEPFLRRDLPDILDYFLNQRKFMVQVTSNGLLNEQIIRTVRDLASPRLHVCISLDGVGEFVNKMRGIRDYYEIVLNTLRELIEIRKKKRFFLAVNQTIFYSDISQCSKLRPVLQKIGVGNIHYSTEHNLFDTEASEDEKKNCWKKIPRKSLLELKQEFDKFSIDQSLRNVVNKYYFKGLENRVLWGLKNPAFKCTALSSYFRLYPDGEMLTCSVISKPVANLKNTDFNEIWYSPLLERARKTVRECEGCWFGCEVVPNATVSGDIIKGFFYSIWTKNYV